MRRLAAVLLFGVARAARPVDTAPIQDNSFLVEEAYNQEAGVVQHLQLFAWDWKSHGWAWTFTQEWPVPGETHQLSLSVLLSRVKRVEGSATGLGDLALNYRYQLIGGSDARVAVAPRLSVFFPTGSYARSLGAGSAGVQFPDPGELRSLGPLGHALGRGRRVDAASSRRAGRQGLAGDPDRRGQPHLPRGPEVERHARVAMGPDRIGRRRKLAGDRADLLPEPGCAFTRGR
jgi:hypothetical protein